jgi:hypothetical protein
MDIQTEEDSARSSAKSVASSPIQSYSLSHHQLFSPKTQLAPLAYRDSHSHTATWKNQPFEEDHVSGPETEPPQGQNRTASATSSSSALHSHHSLNPEAWERTQQPFAKEEEKYHHNDKPGK